MKSILTLLVALATTAAAETTVRFLAERVPQGIDQVVMFAAEKSSDAFKLPTKHLSPELTPPARAFELRTAAADGRILGRIALPEAGNHFIVLLLPTPETGFRGVVLRSDEPGFRPGDCYLYNNSNQRVVGFMGEKRFQIKPNQGSLIRPIEKIGKGYHDVGFGVDVEADGQTRALSMTRWPIDKQVRTYVFFFVNDRTKRVDYRAVDEFISPAKPQ